MLKMWSKSIEERSVRCERLNAIERMIKANATKEQIIFIDIQRQNTKKQKVLYM